MKKLTEKYIISTIDDETGKRMYWNDSDGVWYYGQSQGTTYENYDEANLDVPEADLNLPSDSIYPVEVLESSKRWSKMKESSEDNVGWAIRMPNKMYYGYTWTKDINDAAIFNTEQEARNEFRRINDGSKPFKLVKVDLSGWNGYEILEEKPLKESKNLKKIKEGLFDDIEFEAELSTPPMEKYKDVISMSVDEGILNRETPRENIENTIYEVLRMFPEDNINGEILRNYVCRKVYERNPYEEEADCYLRNPKKVVRESVSKKLRKEVYDILVDYLSEMGDPDYPFHKSIFKKAFDQWIDENTDKFEEICQSGDAQDIADELYSIFDEEDINSKCFDF